MPTDILNNQEREPTSTLRRQAICCNLSGPNPPCHPYYIIRVLLILSATILILIALFTNNWDKTGLHENTYYTKGLWFTCRIIHNKPPYNYWYTFCDTLIYTKEPWLIVCQVLYTIAACLNVIGLDTLLTGLCCDMVGHRSAMPSLSMWIIMSSCVFQVVTISVYGAKGIGDYTLLEPDYSIIISAVAVLVDFLCVVSLFIELMCQPSKTISIDL